MKLNIAVAGGPCTGKSTLAATLFAKLKFIGFDYDLIAEESRKLRPEFGDYRSPFERFYMWRQQNREEERSTAADGFVTDAPLFGLYVGARMHVREPRDNLAVRELFRMCLEINDRYALIVMAENLHEIAYKTDGARAGDEDNARKKHDLTRSFVEHFWPERLLLVRGLPSERVTKVLTRLEQLRSGTLPQQQK